MLPLQSQGKLYVVGIGPGKGDLLTIRAKKVLEEADVILGHRTYVQRILSELPGIFERSGRFKQIVESRMGKELERVKLAVDLARDKKVCLISGGDPSIYGMASLVVEYIVRNGIEVDLEIVPGVTAECAASPLLGCPISGDHCILSLSDLLTPWEVIERRLISALLGDFVIVIYNPSSRRREKNLKKAMELVLRFRGDVPVGCVRNAEREGTEVWITRPSKLLGDESKRVDMHTVLFISSYETVNVNGKLLTPRGYSNKYDVGTADSKDLKDKDSDLKDSSKEKLAEVAGAKTEESLRIAESSAEVAKKLIRGFGDEVERFIAERCFVATADVSVLSLLEFNRAGEAVRAAKDCKTIVTDVEMVRAGVVSRAKGKKVISAIGLELEPKLDRQTDRELKTGKTLSSAGIRRCSEWVKDGLVAIGNSPSALEELCTMIDEGIKPKAVVATPVGFTNATKAKEELMQKDIPWIVVKGARGGSTLCVAIVNALLAF